MSKKISQRQAQRTRKELREVQNKYGQLVNRYSSEYPGVALRNFTMSEATKASLDVAVSLGHGLAAKVDGDKLVIWALRK